MATTTNTISFEQAFDRIRSTVVNSFEVELKLLQYSGGTGFKIDGSCYEFDAAAWDTACNYLAIHPELLPHLGLHRGSLVSKCLQSSGWRAKKAPDTVRLSRDEGGKIIAVTDTKLACLSNQELVSAIQDVWPDHISSETLSLACFSLTPAEFELTCHTEQLTAEPRPGDVLHGGITIHHSQAGTSPTVILSYIHRLVCTNGMTQRVCLQGRSGRTKRCQVRNSTERTLEAIRQQVKQAWTQLDERLGGIRRLLDHHLEIDELPEGLRRRWSINRKMAAEINKALQEDELNRTYTEYDLVNALSRIATHSENLAPRYRRHLSLAAGMFAQRHIHQCPQCGTWLDEASNTFN